MELEQDVILVGVGGQGILTIAQVISSAALKRGLQIKQAEMHGMAQRGGSVQSHLRLSERQIHSDLIPVGMADAIRGQRYEIEMAELSAESTARLAAVLAEHGLERLTNARNPLDITPMASEEVYEGAIRVLLDSDEVDAVVVGIVPLTSALKSVPGELEAASSLAERLPRVFAETRKPIIAVVDSGARYDPLVRALRRGGLPVFPSADQAVRSLGRYLCHRVAT